METKFSEHRVEVAARPLRALDVSVARHNKTLAVVPRKHKLNRGNAHPAAKAVVFAVLVWSACLKTQTVGARDLEVHFPLRGRLGESHPKRPV